MKNTEKVINEINYLDKEKQDYLISKISSQELLESLIEDLKKLKEMLE